MIMKGKAIHKILFKNVDCVNIYFWGWRGNPVSKGPSSSMYKGLGLIPPPPHKLDKVVNVFLAIGR